MQTHPYLEHSLAVLQARLKTPTAAIQIAPGVGAQPFVTISREVCAGATTVGELLMPVLNREFADEGQSWVFLDKNLLAHALTRQKLEERLAEFLPEDRISEIRGMIGELMGLHPSLWQLEHQVAEVILQLAHVGHFLFVGRGAHLITQSLPGGFHARLVAPLDVRIRRMMDLQNCGASAAAALVQKADLARRRHLQSNFGQDIDDPRSYDLVINTGRMSAAAAARLIIEGLRRRLAELQGS
ncbi:MAG TPA: cytidylate kinase-like family protein [Opitutaceae bacterium]|nr:cytidylate kinase-like family protein [Opitutaceae bacterium]